MRETVTARPFERIASVRRAAGLPDDVFATKRTSGVFHWTQKPGDTTDAPCVRRMLYASELLFRK
jgi:hypothetical protein